MYYLSHDIEVSRATGINIQSPGVTLDLNGFEIRRVSDSGGHGILIATTADACTIKNGSIRGFAYGVRAFSEGGHYRGLEVSHCSVAAIIGGARWHIDDCHVQDNAGTDILVGDGSTITIRPTPADLNPPASPRRPATHRRGTRVHL
jgi:hypothetical protein